MQEREKLKAPLARSHFSWLAVTVYRQDLTSERACQSGGCGSVLFSFLPFFFFYWLRLSIYFQVSFTVLHFRIFVVLWFATHLFSFQLFIPILIIPLLLFRGCFCSSFLRLLLLLASSSPSVVFHRHFVLETECNALYPGGINNLDHQSSDKRLHFHQFYFRFDILFFSSYFEKDMVTKQPITPPSFASTLHPVSVIWQLYLTCLLNSFIHF